MLKGKTQQLPQVEIIALPPLKMVLVHTKEDRESKVKAGVLNPATKQAQIKSQVLTKIIEYLEKKP
jgi:hypothetical protein